MKKCIASLCLAVCLCFSSLTVVAGAAETKPTVSGIYQNGVVTVKGTGFPSNTAYNMISVKDGGDKLIALGSAETGGNGAFSTPVTTGAISAPNSCKVYVYNNVEGTIVASGAVSTGGESGGNTGDHSDHSSHSGHHHHNGGSSGSSSGTKPSVPSAPSGDNTFASDTTNDFSVSGAYQFKITSKDGKAPVFTVGTPGVFDVRLVKTSGNDYFFELTAIGAPGAQAGIYVNGRKLLVATVGSSNGGVKCDTTLPFQVKTGSAYVFKLTAKTKPAFICGNGSVFAVSFVGQKGNDYFFRAAAVGKAGNSAGFYVNGEKMPRTVGTISK